MANGDVASAHSLRVISKRRLQRLFIQRCSIYLRVVLLTVSPSLSPPHLAYFRQYISICGFVLLLSLFFSASIYIARSAYKICFLIGWTPSTFRFGLVVDRTGGIILPPIFQYVRYNRTTEGRRLHHGPLELDQ